MPGVVSQTNKRKNPVLEAFQEPVMPRKLPAMRRYVLIVVSLYDGCMVYNSVRQPTQARAPL